MRVLPSATRWTALILPLLALAATAGSARRPPAEAEAVAPGQRAVDARTASVITVTAVDDANDGTCAAAPGHCSLREAIEAANASAGADVIDFDASASGTITLSSALPHLTDAVDVVGPGAGTLVVAAGGNRTILWVDPGVTAGVSGIGLSGGVGSGAGGTTGGAIVNQGALTLRGVEVQGNQAQGGGGVFNDFGADLDVLDSTFRGNTASNFGGAIYSVGGGTVVRISGSTFTGNTSGTGVINAPGGTAVTITNSTISGNVATYSGGTGGILGSYYVIVESSTIVGNTGIGLWSSRAHNTIVDSCGTGGGAVTSNGHNLASSSACFAAAGPGDVFAPSFVLGPLQINGGPTATHALLTGSPAIDAADPTACQAVDQRGFERPAGSSCDIGAFEYRAQQPATATPTPPPTATPQCVTPPTGMVAWYPLDEAPGATSVSDIWGAHHGAPQPGAVSGTFSSGAGPVWGAGAPVSPPFQVNGSLYFWEMPVLVDVPHHPALDLATTGELSIDAWVYSTTAIGGGPSDSVSPIVDKFDVTAQRGYGLYWRHPVSGPDTLELVYGDGSGIVTATSAAPSLAQLVWLHLAVTVRTLPTGQLDIRFYVDGSPQGSTVAAAPAGPVASTQNLHVGGWRLVPAVIGQAGFIEVGIDELEIFSREITAAEVQAIYQAGGFGKCRPAPEPTPAATATRTPWTVTPVPIYLPSGISSHPNGRPTPTAARTATPVPTAPPSETAEPPATTGPTATDTDVPTPSAEATASATPTTPETATATATATTTASATASATATTTPTTTATATATPGCAPRPVDLAAWWPMDEVSGDQVRDVIGGHDGTAVWGATVEDPAKVAAGRAFDGLSGLVDVPTHPDLDPGVGDFSIDAWIRPTGDGVRPILAKQYSPADAPLGYVLLLAEGHLQLAIDSESSHLSATAPTALVPDGKWHFVAAVVERGSPTGGRLYVDGTLVHTFDTTPLQGAVSTAATLFLGHQAAIGRGQAARFFGGGIDEVELLHRALTADEVSALFAAGALGKCDKPPTATPTLMTTSQSHSGYGRVR